MTLFRSLRNNFKLPPAGLMFQLFVIILLPLTLLLVAITFGSISIHNQAMRALVGERDQRAVSIHKEIAKVQIEMRQAVTFGTYRQACYRLQDQTAFFHDKGV